jgi:hypothetical protein
VQFLGLLNDRFRPKAVIQVCMETGIADLSATSATALADFLRIHFLASTVTRARSLRADLAAYSMREFPP